uniref:Uncharacterized protein n=1 Tax=Anguilla anguilla TaxID=7936 RepID=A0A0E9PGI1_ANGAN
MSIIMFVLPLRMVDLCL